MVVGNDLAAVLQTAVESCVSDTTLGAGTAESVKAVTAVTDIWKVPEYYHRFQINCPMKHWIIFRDCKIFCETKGACKTFCKAKTQICKAVWYYKAMNVRIFVLQNIILIIVYSATCGCNYMGCGSPCQDEKMMAA